MPALREIRQRIKGTKNMAKITQAMQMVASSKMRRVQERVEQARPYSEQLRGLVSRLANASGDDLDNELALLKQRPVRNIGMILVTPDRGLCGALPSNINRYAALTAQPAIAQVAVDAFLKGEVDVVYLVYAKFINTMTQQPTAIQLLPVQPPTEQGKSSTDYIYEPSPGEIFQALLPRYVDVQVYQALLEAVASEQSAKMVAMKNATDNANELVQDLTLTYNKARQAAITTQILEIVAGVEEL